MRFVHEEREKRRLEAKVRTQREQDELNRLQRNANIAYRQQIEENERRSVKNIEERRAQEAMRRARADAPRVVALTQLSEAVTMDQMVDALVAFRDSVRDCAGAVWISTNCAITGRATTFAIWTGG